MMKYCRFFYKQTKLNKNILLLSVSAYLLFLITWTLTNIAPQSKNFVHYISIFCQGKVYFTLILLLNLFVLRSYLYESNSFIRIREESNSINKQNIFNIFMTSFVNSIFTISFVVLIYASLYSNKILGINILIKVFLLGFFVIFISLLTASLFYYLLNNLIFNSSITLVLMITLLNIAAYFPSSPLHYLTNMFEYKEKLLGNLPYLQGQTLLLIGESLLFYIVATWFFERKEHIEGVSSNGEV